MPRERDNKSESITAQNTWTEALDVKPDEKVSISVSGIAGGTIVTVQRRVDGTNWRDIVTNGRFTADDEKTYYADESCDVRIGVKTGEFGSGTAVVRLGRG